MLCISLVLQLEDKGPYVYTRESKKIDVYFHSDGRVSYKEYVKHTFNKERTAELCKDCKEHDKVTPKHHKNSKCT